MKHIFLIGFMLLFAFQFTNCKSKEVREEQLDDALEEELRAEAEPIREIKERDFREEVRRPAKKK